jgi:hypothetical protein
MSNANVTLELLSQYLDARDFAHTVNEDGRVIETGFTGDTGIFKVSVVLWGEAPMKLFIGVRIPIIVPEKRRPAMAEAITRANFGMALGGFEMEMGTGFLGFKADMAIADGTVTEEQFHTLLIAAMGTADTYLPAFLRLIYGDDLSPAKVVAEVEMAK